MARHLLPRQGLAMLRRKQCHLGGACRLARARRDHHDAHIEGGGARWTREDGNEPGNIFPAAAPLSNCLNYRDMEVASTKCEPQMGLARSKDPAVIVQYRVLKALILRDIRTRFFGNGLGYIVAILWPLTHIVALLLIFYFSGRIAPYGDSIYLFFASALIPSLGFRYMSRFIIFSVGQNRPLTAFPLVKYMDIILARGILEAAALCCVAALMALILFFLGEPVMPENPIGAAEAFLATLLIGLGFGAFCGVIAIKLPGIILPVILIHVVVYLTSGIIFVPAALPEQILDIIYWNPVLHAVEWMRESYYIGYVSPILDKEYLLGSGALFLFMAMVIEKAFYSFLTRN